VSTLGKGLDIADTAEEFLQCIIDHYAAAPGDVEPLPERQCVVSGDARTIAWDCDQLTVSLDGIGYGPAQDNASDSARSGSPISATAVRHAVLVVQLVRCIPAPDSNGNVSRDAIHAAGLRYLRDSGMISQAVTAFAARVRKGLEAKTESVIPGVVDVVGPLGDKAALETTLAITVLNLR
jgi:hypothetical protein